MPKMTVEEAKALLKRPDSILSLAERAAIVWTLNNTPAMSSKHHLALFDLLVRDAKRNTEQAVFDHRLEDIFKNVMEGVHGED